MYSTVVLLKSSGVSQGFDSVANALAAADANSLINLYPGAHSVSSTLTAKSNVTINLTPGASLTLEHPIQVGAGVTNFKIVGDGDVEFTGRAFELVGIAGSGVEVRVKGNVTIGDYVLFVTGAHIQTNSFSVVGRNITIAGAVYSEGRKAIAVDEDGTNALQLILKAEERITVPCLTVIPSIGGSSLRVVADEVLCTGASDQVNVCSSATIIARLLNLAAVTSFDDPEANSCNFYFEVDHIKLSVPGGGIYWNGSLTALVFRKHVRILNENTGAASHVMNGINDGSNLFFLEGAVLVTKGSGTSYAAAGASQILANRDVIGNKGFDGNTSSGAGVLVVDADTDIL